MQKSQPVRRSARLRKAREGVSEPAWSPPPAARALTQKGAKGEKVRWYPPSFLSQTEARVGQNPRLSSKLPIRKTGYQSFHQFSDLTKTSKLIKSPTDRAENSSKSENNRTMRKICLRRISMNPSEDQQILQPQRVIPLRNKGSEVLAANQTPL